MLQASDSSLESSKIHASVQSNPAVDSFKVVHIFSKVSFTIMQLQVGRSDVLKGCATA